MGKATVYRWWPRKVDLVVEALHDSALELVPEPDTGSLRDDVRELIEGLVALVSSPVGQVLAEVWSESERSPELKAALERVFLTRRRQVSRGVLDKAAKRLEVSEGLDIDLVSEVVVAAVFYRAKMGNEGLGKEFIDSLTDLLMSGIAANASTMTRNLR